MTWHVVWEILQDTGPKTMVYKEEKQGDVLIVLQLKVTVSFPRIPFARNSLLSGASLPRMVRIPHHMTALHKSDKEFAFKEKW